MDKKEHFVKSGLRYDTVGLWMVEENGKEHCMMYNHEKPYIEKGVVEICNKIKPRSVIEVGWGLGFTAKKFQELGVKRHVIIEANRQLYETAKAWAKGKLGVKVIFGFWQDLELKEKFDLLYFDTYEIANPVINVVELLEKKFNYEWYACAYQDIGLGELNQGKGFEFEVTMKCFQPLIKVEREEK